MYSGKTIALIGCCALLLIGCQQRPDEVQSFDPVLEQIGNLPANLPTQIDGHHFSQKYGDITFFWTLLPNESMQPRENLVLQIVASNPYRIPPERFNLLIPDAPGKKIFDKDKAYETWTIVEDSDTCLISRQYIQSDVDWISIFTNYCTPLKRPIPAWTKGGIFLHPRM